MATPPPPREEIEERREQFRRLREAREERGARLLQPQPEYTGNSSETNPEAEDTVQS